MRARPGQAFAFIEAALVAATDDCILWPFGRYSTGYGQVHFEGQRRNAHRVALILATGIDPPDMEAAHGPCHTPACVNPRHLSWKTFRENNHDKQRDGTALYGEKNHSTKLTAAQVLEIHRLRAEGWLYRELAKEFNISRAQIGSILRGESWPSFKEAT
jgi:hypothetical protein